MKGTIQQLADWVNQLDTRVATINDRTKIHTLDIKKLERQMKELSECKESKSKTKPL